MDKDKILFSEESYIIQGAVFAVYREMGCGFLEAVYQACLAKEFEDRRIPFTAQQELNLTYKGQMLEQKYKPDFICYGKIIIEIKAVKELAPEHEAQIFNYLKATNLKLGLLVNFGHYPKVRIKRIVLYAVCKFFTVRLETIFVRIPPHYTFSGGRVSSRAGIRSTFTARQSLALH